MSSEEITICPQGLQEILKDGAIVIRFETRDILHCDDFWLNGFDQISKFIEQLPILVFFLYACVGRKGLTGRTSSQNFQVAFWIQVKQIIRCHRLDFGMDEPGTKRSEEHTSELQSQSNLVCR